MLLWEMRNVGSPTFVMATSQLVSRSLYTKCEQLGRELHAVAQREWLTFSSKKTSEILSLLLANNALWNVFETISDMHTAKGHII